MPGVRRVRMFAGPNGSGKTTLFCGLAREHSKLGVFSGEPFVNADHIEAELRKAGSLALARYGIAVAQDELAAWLRAAAWSDDTRDIGDNVKVTNGAVVLPAGAVPSYAAALLAAFIRSKLLDTGRSFSFETVMSHPGKVALLREAKALGFRTYLYFVATDDARLNVCRVQVRVQSGGHAVPEEKIRERYRRSLELLPQAVRETDRAYLFDNSTSQHVLLAEFTAGKLAAVHVDEESAPAWFRRLLDTMRA